MNTSHHPAADDSSPEDSSPTDASPSIRLDQFMKVAGLVGTGGQAKMLIQDGEVMVNDTIEKRRRRQLKNGDVVVFDGEEFLVEFGED
ncbi:MAG: RNA-binding S4 domain-containing protein [Planctomycetaceae bacterium]|nr:RNA-binding S4 domain-containing protein [Planctomycetaceae bacterium]